MFIGVFVALLLKIKISLGAGVVLVGVQFVATVQSAVPVWFHVYVVCEKPVEQQNKIITLSAKKRVWKSRKYIFFITTN